MEGGGAGGKKCVTKENSKSDLNSYLGFAKIHREVRNKLKS